MMHWTFLDDEHLQRTLTESGVVKGIGMYDITAQPDNLPLNSRAAFSSNDVTLEAVPLASDVRMRNVLGVNENILSSVVAGRTFTSIAPGMQWRPGSPFQNPKQYNLSQKQAEAILDIILRKLTSLEVV